MIGRLRSSSFALELENPAKLSRSVQQNPAAQGPGGPGPRSFSPKWASLTPSSSAFFGAGSWWISHLKMAVLTGKTRINHWVWRYRYLMTKKKPNRFSHQPWDFMTSVGLSNSGAWGACCTCWLEWDDGEMWVLVVFSRISLQVWIEKVRKNTFLFPWGPIQYTGHQAPCIIESIDLLCATRSHNFHLQYHCFTSP